MRTRKSNSATIKDVALACGVSEATVSYVINGKRVLRQDTRDRVSRAMRELNYHPSAVARGLSSKRIHTLGVLLGAVDPVNFLVNHYAAGLMQGIVAEAQRADFNITLFTECWKTTESNVAKLCDGRTDGIIVIGPFIGSPILPTLGDRHMPAVGISSESYGDIPVVDVDNEAGVRLAVNHVLSLGHRRIAYLSGNNDLSSYQPRMDGFRGAMSDAGIAPNEDYILLSDFNASPVPHQTRALLSLSNPPTAIVAGNDYIAMEVINAAHAEGIDVPRDLSVVGFDDAPVARVFRPRLTTVVNPLEETGAKAANLLINHIVNRGEPITQQIFLLPAKLVDGETTAPPRCAEQAR